jgi:hypothetical protein
MVLVIVAAIIAGIVISRALSFFITSFGPTFGLVVSDSVAVKAFNLSLLPVCHEGVFWAVL